MSLEGYSDVELTRELQRRERVRTIKPKRLDNPDFSELCKACQAFIAYALGDDGVATGLGYHYNCIASAALRAIYGEGILPFIKAAFIED